MHQSYSREIMWRVFYMLFSRSVCTLQAWVDGADVLRDLMLEPWFRLWGGETMFYSEPNELWQVELILSIIVGTWFVIPIIGGHIIIFMCNSLRYNELRAYFLTWLCSCVFLCTTWIVLVEYEGIGLLMDLSHGDNEGAESMVYVPTLAKYRSAWVRLMLLMGLSRQLPLLWIVSVLGGAEAPRMGSGGQKLREIPGLESGTTLGVQRTSNSHLEASAPRGARGASALPSAASATRCEEPWSVIFIHERTKFFIVFAIPVLASALLLIDEPRTAALWRLILWFIYLSIMLTWVTVQVARKGWVSVCF